MDVDSADLDTLYRQLQPALLAHLRLAHAGQAEDIASDVWTEVVASFPRFVGGNDAFRAWIFTLARRRLIDAYRRAGRRPTVALSGDLYQVAADRPEDETMAHLSQVAVVARLRQVLSADQAEIVLFRVVSGLSVDEVATLTTKTSVNVRVLHHRGLQRLATRLDSKDVG